VIGINATIDCVLNSGVQVADNTDVVFDVSGGTLNLEPGYPFYVNAPVIVGALSVSYLASINITNGSLTITGAANVVRYPGDSAPPAFALGPASQLVVATGATLTYVGAPDAVLFSGASDLSPIVNDGIINVSAPAIIQSVGLSGNGDVSIYGSLSVANSTFSQHRVTLLGAVAEFIGEATGIGYLGVVSGTPFVNATIGAETYSCPEQCDGISFPAANFRFITCF
jgi:hypothetical protein